MYSRLRAAWPKEWAHRSATFVRDDLHLNFVLLVSDGKPLHHHTAYHLGIDVGDKRSAIGLFHRARHFGASVVKPPRTTWRGSPLHQLWHEGPDGNPVEIYARLTGEQFADLPQDQELAPLVRNTV